MGPELFWLVRVVLQIAFAIGAGAACVVGWRWSCRVWRPAGMVLGLGIVLRAWSGLALFAISYFNVPILQSLHSGDGFWELAPDARMYYAIAADAAAGTPIPSGSPSPSFIEPLSVWFRAAGDSPASPILFNLVLYVALAVLLIAAVRPLVDSATRRALLLAMAAFSFSPVMVLVGTQPLKDVFSAFLTVVATLSMLSLVDALSAPTRKTIATALGIILAVYLMAGVRAYYALFMWGAAATAIVVAVIALPRRLAVRRIAPACAALGLLWCAFMWGAGPYYAYYGDAITRTIGVHLPGITPDSMALSELPKSETSGVDAVRSNVQVLRQGFIRSGGATNLGTGPTNAAAGQTARLVDDLRALAIGGAAMMVPITLLKQLSIVDFSGGRGFLFVMEADTIFINLSLLAVACMLFTSGRRIRRHLPFTCFSLALGIVTAVLMAYVVTNYGTLFRLRLLVTIPFWILPIALSRVEAARNSEQTGARRTEHLVRTPDQAPAPSQGVA